MKINISAFRAFAWRMLPYPIKRMLGRIRRWLFIGFVILFFFGIVWQIFQFGKGGVLDLWDALFAALNISLYTNQVPLVAGVLTTLVLATIIGALLDWKLSKRALSAIPLIGNLFGLTTSVIESIGDLKGMPAVLVESFTGLRQLGFVSGFEPIRSWKPTSQTGGQQREWKLFGVPVMIGREKIRRLRFRIYYPDFPFIINGRGGWAEAPRLEWILNSFEEIFARLASAGFATRLKTGEPIVLSDEEWRAIGLDVVELTEEELKQIVAQSRKINSSAK